MVSDVGYLKVLSLFLKFCHFEVHFKVDCQMTNLKCISTWTHRALILHLGCFTSHGLM